MGRNESEARRAKVEKEIATKVGRDFGEKNPSKFAKDYVKHINSGKARR